jgi:hypothetical protein
MIDPYVLRLQRTLNTYTDTPVSVVGPFAPGHETDYFAPRTLNAVLRFRRSMACDRLCRAAHAGRTSISSEESQKVRAILVARSRLLSNNNPICFQQSSWPCRRSCSTPS